MSEIVLSSSSNSVDKAIDEYTDPSSFSGSSDSNSIGNGSYQFCQFWNEM